VGKWNNPKSLEILRCFRNININELPVVWKLNEKAWMTTALMEEQLKGFNERMRQQKRSIVLFLDNATCHPHLELSNIYDFYGFHLT
jgi:hypothetical protein